MTNYTAIRTCAAIGENTALELIESGKDAYLDSVNADLCLGGNAGWDQRRAFEWGFLAASFRRSGDDATATYCAAKIAEIAARTGY